MSDKKVIGNIFNPERVLIGCEGIKYNGAKISNDSTKTGIDADYIVSFLPKAKNPKNLREIIINENQIGDIIESTPSDYTSGFWKFYVKLRKES